MPVPSGIVFYNHFYMKHPNFEDAHAMHLLHPGTFDLPSRNKLERLRPGDHAKVCAAGERFWCKVLWRRATDVIGIIDNDLVISAHQLQLNDVVSFSINNIYQVMPQDAAAKLPKFMLMADDELNDAVIIYHSQYPRMLVQILFEQDEIKARDHDIFDEPIDYKKEVQPVVMEAVRWFKYKHLRKEH